MRIDYILEEVATELFKATQKFGAFASPHEGIAVIREEFEELWDCVKDKAKGHVDARKEAIQVAAMAVRYVWDICTPPGEKE